MKYTITGDNLQFVNVQLENGETFQSNAGSMKYMTGNMTMEAKMKGGLFSGLKRSLSGSSLFLMNYKSNGGSGVVGFGGSAPGKIVDLDIGWIASVSEKFGIPLEQDRLKPMVIAIDGGFSKIIDRYIFEHEGDFQEDLRTLMILLFTLLNLPLHSIGHLTQRFVEMFSSAETWSNMELWRKE
jgi:hypothetical protein